MYRFSGYLWVETMEQGGNGANLAVEDVYAFSERVFDTQSQWKYVEWYGETGENQHDLQLGARIGGYGAESQGTAYFDDLSVVKVDTLPDGVVATLLFTYDAGNDSAGDAEDAEPATPKANTLWFLLIAASFALLAAMGVKVMFANEAPTLTNTHAKAQTLAFALAMVAALALRVVLAGKVLGYPVDMGCFSAWSLRMASTGPWGFYAEGYFCDYPPGYMLLLWPIGLVLQAVGYAETPLVRLIVKSVPILFDCVAGLMLFTYAKKRIPMPAAIFVALLFLFNPAALVNGAAWGQVDSVLALLLMLCAITAMDKRWRVALPLYAVAVLMKPQAILFAPVAGIWLLMSLILAEKKERRAQWRSVWHGLLIALLCAAAIVVPFSIRQKDPLWLLSLYQGTIASYDYATLNTANLLYLLGGNWSRLTGDAEYQLVTLHWLVPTLTGLALLAAG